MRRLKKEDKLFIQIFKEIRSYIIDNELKEGDFLPTEHTLCAELGISRNSLREAIKSMELIGMVEACPGKGTMIKSFNLDFLLQNVLFFHLDQSNDRSIREMFDIRKMLELAYMEAAFAALNENDVKKLRECAESLEKKYDKSGYFEDADKEFHMTIFRPLNNGILISLLEAIWAVDNSFELEKKQPHLKGSIAKHFAIVEAVEKKDYPAFKKAMEWHFSSGKYSKDVESYEEY